MNVMQICASVMLTLCSQISVLVLTVDVLVLVLEASVLVLFLRVDVLVLALVLTVAVLLPTLSNALTFFHAIQTCTVTQSTTYTRALRTNGHQLKA